MSEAAIKKYASGEARKILSAAMKGENNPIFGKTHSEETRAKQSAAMKGRTHSAETRKKISETKKGIARPEKAGKPAQKIEVFDIENNITTIYDSMHEAARETNIKYSVISMFIKNNQKKPYKGRYSFKKFEG
uniref:GIY-YIG endonuclease n=1 Tax=Orbilia oligospora TaxID=2813651 RepID=A0A6G6A4W4_ORBOL|nr:GIY-YIG endonuclease [Orbilia oligospora]